MSNPFDNAEIISVYTRQDAIRDGVFTDVTEVSNRVGFKIPVALTTNLYSKYFESNDPQMLTDFLFSLAIQIKREGKKDDNMLCTKINIGAELVEIWACVEPQSPTDPSPAMNVMLPEDY